MNIKEKKLGFTLIETLVAMAIFSTAVMIALAIFINSTTLQQRTLAIQRGQSDARYALELMARKFRLGEIDYEYYDGTIISPTTILALRDSNGLPVQFKLESSVIKMCSNFDQDENCTNWVNVTPNNININNLKFYLAPNQSPFILLADGSYQNNNQERLTIVLESTVTQTKGSYYPTHFQTSVSSRVYKR